MNKEWSLDALYKGLNDPRYVSDWKRLNEVAEEAAAFVKEEKKQDAKTLKRGLQIVKESTELVTKIADYNELRSSVNTQDTEAIAEMDKVRMKDAELTGFNTSFIEYVASLEDMDALIASDAFLKEHAFFLKSLKDKKKYTLDGSVEESIALFSITGSKAWGDLQSFLTSTVPVSYEGETTTLSDIRNKAYDADPEVRKKAYEAELACYDRIKDAIAFSLNSIKMETINECKMRGYESPLDATLKESFMKRETLDALMKAMEEAMPKFWEYLRAKAGLLGYEGGIKWYDLFAPLEGNTEKFGTEDAKNYLVELFSGFDKEEADMIARAFDESWIDFFPHEGKVGGAFCCPVPSLKESRVLTNFDGTLGDVVTLAHELGHAFHNHCMRDNSILNTDVSMPVCETASTFNEVVAMNAAIEKESDPIVKRALIESQLMDATQIICDIYSRYTFETEVFEKRKEGFLFADDLCKIMLDAQKKGYGDGLDENCMHPFMWACKSHYYGTPSFYNFPYAFGGLFARGLYAKYLHDGKEFVPLYKRLLKATGDHTVEEAAAIAGIDLTDIGFWRDSLKILTDEIDEFVELCKL